MSTVDERNTVREKAIRGIFSGLLGTSLSLNELAALLDELDSELLASVRGHLTDYLSRNQGEPSIEWSTSSENFINYPDKELLAEHIYLLAKSKRISKDRLITYIKRIDPSFDPSFFRSELSIRDLVLRYVDQVDPTSSTLLLEVLGQGIEEDPYLRGISHQKRK